MDDLIIPSKDEEEGLIKLKEVLKVSAENGLQIKWSKCNFLKRRVQFLGHIIEDGIVRPSEEKITAVRNYPEPENIKKLQGFLGLTGYFRKFVYQYSILARSLSNLLKKGVKLNIGKEERIAINELKNALLSSPVLKIYQQGAPIELHTDASKLGFGAILMQRSENNELHPVHYMSKKTTEAEEKLHSYYLEVKAVYIAMEKFRVYLLRNHFKVITDCAAFQSSKYNEESRSSTSC